MFGRKEKPIPKTHHTIPPGFGSPIADGMECMAETLAGCAETVRKYEPLSIEIMRRNMRRIVRAQGEFMDAIGALLEDLGR